MTYDPTMRALVAQCEDDWGDPLVNRQSLVPYGIDLIDMATYGIDLNGEFILIQGDRKNRKTTFLTNILANVFTREKTMKPVIGSDVLETGIRPKKYRDMLLSNVASRYLIEQGHRPEQCPVCRLPECKQLGIHPKFLRYNTRTQEQLDAIDYAKWVTSEWSLLIHGAGREVGNTRDLKGSLERWVRMKDEYGLQVITVDHIQQYAFADEPTDYEKQIRAVGMIGDFVAKYSVTCLALSQVSMGSLRESKTTGGKLTAAGGAKAAQEANTVFSTGYTDGTDFMKIRIEEAREASGFTVYQKIDPSSGAFYGQASTEPFIY